MMVTKMRITCSKTLKCHSLDSIQKITANRRGSRSKALNTEHFVLMIYLKQRDLPPNLNSTADSEPSSGQTWRAKKQHLPPIKILSTKNDVRIRKELLLLRKFLNLDVE